MQGFILRNWSIVRTGTTAAHKTLFFNFRRLRARIEETSGRPFDDDGRAAVAAELSVPVSDVSHMEGRLSITDQSLNARVGEEGETEWRSEEHTSELPSLMRISYAVFCLKKKNKHKIK